MSDLFTFLRNKERDGTKGSHVFYKGESLVWDEVFKIVDNLSEELISLGVLQGDHVIIEIDTSIDFLLALLASIKLKLVVAPLSPDLSNQELNCAIDSIRPKFLIKNVPVDSQNERYFQRFIINKKCKIKEKNFNLLLSKEVHLMSNISLTEISKEGAFIRFTSGTTGLAKGVLISFKKALERIKIFQENFLLKDSDVVLSLLPLPYHFIAALLSFVSSGATVILSKSVADFPKGLLEDVTFIYGAPFHYDTFNGLDEVKFKNLRLALSTSINLQEKTYSSFLKKYEIPICQSYGIIEVGVSAANLITPDEIHQYDSIGKLFPHYQFSIFEDLDSSNQGALRIAGPGLFDAYLEPFSLASDILIDGQFVTGDRVNLVSNRLKLIGRSSSAINVGGYKIFPEEIEEVILQIPQIKEVQVKGVSHKIFGNTLKAEIVLKDHAVISAREIKVFCKNNLQAIKVPLDFEFASNLEKNAAGKLYR